MKFKLSALCALLLSFPLMANAALINPVSISGTGSFINSPDLIGNNVFPNEGSAWNAATNVRWSGTNPIFTLNFGAVFQVDNVLLSVDNNDSYAIEWSVNSSIWNSLFNVSSSHGEQTWGMDTLSTDSANAAEYIPALDFASVQAQYLRIRATGGDNLYSVGELQAFGTAVASGNVPVPAPLALFGLGLVILGCSRKK